MRRTATTVFVSAFLGLLLGAGGTALAGSDPPPQRPPLADCRAVWNDGSARNSCYHESISTHPGKCRIEAWCPAGPRFPWQGHSESSVPRDGCLYVGERGQAAGRYFRFDCLTDVDFQPDDSLSNCDGQLRTVSSC